MSFLQAAGLIVRLFSLWMFLFALQSGAAAWAIHNNAGYASATGTSASVLVFAPALAALLIGIFLWRFPLAVARLLVPRTSDNAAPISLRECWRLASIAIGLLVLAESGPLLLRCLAMIVYNTHHDLETLPSPLQGTLVEAASKLVFALFLILGSNTIYRRFGESR